MRRVDFFRSSFTGEVSPTNAGSSGRTRSLDAETYCRGLIMMEAADFRSTTIPLNNGVGHIPALGFGTLVPDPATTVTATRDALVAGVRQFDCAERYRHEHEVAQGLQAGLAVAGIERKDIFLATKLWNTNHRPERVEPAFEA